MSNPVRATTAATADTDASAPHDRLAPLWGVLLAVLVPVVVAGGLVTIPLDALDLRRPVFGAFFVVSLAAIPRAAWRTVVPWTYVGFWVVLALWFPVALDRAPVARLGAREVDYLAQAALLTTAVLLFTQGRRRGLLGMRVGWALALAMSCGIAAWELTTRQHLWIGPTNPWAFADPMITAGTFINPNNFAGALTAMAAGTLALAASTRSRGLQLALYALVAFTTFVVFFTGSRSGLAALGVVIALEVWRRVLEGLGGRSLREVARRHAKVLAAIVVGGIALVIAVASIPVSVISRNPVRRLVFGHFDPATAKSDDLRAQLIDAAFRYLRDSNYLGSGAGSFEPLLAADPNPGVILRTNLHNAFVELVTQYGVVVGAAFALMFVTVVATLVVSALRPDDAPMALLGERRIARHEAYGYLVAFVAFGVSASSALSYTTWWLSLAAATAAAWWLAASRREGEPLARAAAPADLRH